MPTYVIRTQDDAGVTRTYEVDQDQPPTMDAAQQMIDSGQAREVPQAFGQPVGEVTPTTPPPLLSPGDWIKQTTQHYAPEVLKTGIATAPAVIGEMTLGPVGAAAGGALGYGTNVLLGLEEPDPSQALIATGLPLGVAGATRAVQRTARGALRSTRGGQQLLREMLDDRTRAWLESYIARVPAEQRQLILDTIEQAGDLPLNPASFLDTVSQLNVPAPLVRGIAGPLLNYEPERGALTSAGGLALRHYQDMYQRTRELFQSASAEYLRTGDDMALKTAEHATSVWRAIEAMLRQGVDDLAGQTGAEAASSRTLLQQLLTGNSRAVAANELEVLLGKHLTRDASGAGTVDFSKLMTELRKSPSDRTRDRLFDHLRETLGSERADIVRDLSALQRKYSRGIQIIPEGADPGTASLLRWAGSAGMGALAGSALDIPAAVAAPAGIALQEAFSLLIMSKLGRAALSRTLAMNGGRITEGVLIALAEAARPHAYGAMGPDILNLTQGSGMPLPFERAVRVMPGRVREPQPPGTASTGGRGW